MTTRTTDVTALTDEHSVLLWQTCAYADDLTEAARSKRRLSPSLTPCRSGTGGAVGLCAPKRARQEPNSRRP